ncbi:LuxR C-terminal-related transcriptional regulator [Streptomyces sp. NPDC005899]|uniref:LuxR C-terminal-related transcriptional regulator n=1 Tax=Streptomyces sp. NPDC005899 TaxID=3155716 RepID=UPI0033E0E0D2
MTEGVGHYELDAVAVAIYRGAAKRSPVSICELREQAELSSATEEELDRAVERLLGLRLLVRVGDAPARYAALPPDLSQALLLGGAERQITQALMRVDQVRRDLMDLSSVYAESLFDRMQDQRVEQVFDVQQVRDLITELCETCRTEVLTSQPGGARRGEELEESFERTEALLSRGVRMRTLYQHTAQFSQETLSYVQWVTGLGAEVRTLADGFPRLIIFDRKIALIDAHTGSQGALLVRSPGVVEFMSRCFNWAWIAADPFPDSYQQDRVRVISDEIKKAIIRFLVLGEDDRVIARRLGMSLRSVQRHVAEIMAQLGATNRLHAGYLLGRAA